MAGLYRELTEDEERRVQARFDELAPTAEEQLRMTPGELVTRTIELSQRAWVLAGLPLPDAEDRNSVRVIDRDTGEVLSEVRRGVRIR